jgi:hypothetical protein
MAEDSHVLAPAPCVDTGRAAARYCGRMHHVRFGGGVQSVSPQSPTGRCWDPTDWVRIDGSQRLVLPLAAPVTRLPHTILPECWARNVRPPNHSHGPVDPHALSALCFPVARLACGRNWTDPAPCSGALDRPIEAPSSPVANS